jgi:hypothetical protein
MERIIINESVNYVDNLKYMMYMIWDVNEPMAF